MNPNTKRLALGICFTLLLFSLSLAAPRIVSPRDATITRSTYTVSWEGEGGYYTLQEKEEGAGSWTTVAGSHPDEEYQIKDKRNDKYYYRVGEAERANEMPLKWSEPVYVEVNSGGGILSRFESIIFTPLHLIVLIITTVSLIVSLLYYYKKYYLVRDLKDKYEELENLFIQRDSAYRLFSKTKNQEGFKRSEGEIMNEQISLRKEIVSLLKKGGPYIEDVKIQEAREIAERGVKKALSYYGDKSLTRRLWLAGLKRYRAQEIYIQIKNKYAEKIDKMKEKGLSNEEIKEKLQKKHGFNESRAEQMISYAIEEY